MNLSSSSPQIGLYVIKVKKIRCFKKNFHTAIQYLKKMEMLLNDES